MVRDCHPKVASMGYLLAVDCLLKVASKDHYSAEDHLKAASEGFHLVMDYLLMVA